MVSKTKRIITVTLILFCVGILFVTGGVILTKSTKRNKRNKIKGNSGAQNRDENNNTNDGSNSNNNVNSTNKQPFSNMINSQNDSHQNQPSQFQVPQTTHINGIYHVLNHANNDCFTVAVLNSFFNIHSFLTFIAESVQIDINHSMVAIRLIHTMLTNYSNNQNQPINLSNYRKNLFHLIECKEINDGNMGDIQEFNLYLLQKLLSENINLGCSIFQFVIVSGASAIDYNDFVVAHGKNNICLNMIYANHLEMSADSDTIKVNDYFTQFIFNIPRLIIIVPKLRHNLIPNNFCKSYLNFNGFLYRLRSACIYTSAHFFAVLFDHQSNAYKVDNSIAPYHSDFSSENISILFYELMPLK